MRYSIPSRGTFGAYSIQHEGCNETNATVVPESPHRPEQPDRGRVFRWWRANDDPRGSYPSGQPSLGHGVPRRIQYGSEGRAQPRFRDKVWDIATFQNNKTYSFNCL